MNKTQLIAAIHDDLKIESWGVSRRAIEAVLESTGRIIAEHFAAADAGVDAEAALPGLGKLKATTRAARTGRNPQTGEPVEIPERMAVKFSAGKALDDWINP